MKLNKCKQIVATALISFAFTPALVAQTGGTAPASTELEAKKKSLYEKFEKTMSGAKLVGNFTLLNAKPDQKLQPEEYVISEVKKLDKGEMWMFKARIKYGGKDVTVPLPLEVQWAGDTPVITLTDFAVPTMGTFSARVVIYNQKYAGTWSHGKEGRTPVRKDCQQGRCRKRGCRQTRKRKEKRESAFRGNGGRPEVVDCWFEPGFIKRNSTSRWIQSWLAQLAKTKAAGSIR